MTVKEYSPWRQAPDGGSKEDRLGIFKRTLSFHLSGSDLRGICSARSIGYLSTRNMKTLLVK
jgi:hypothetical protein